MKEPLFACPLCGRPNFTSRGLRAHWCPAKPAPAGNKKHSAPLTREEWASAVHPLNHKFFADKKPTPTERALASMPKQLRIKPEKSYKPIS